MIDEEEKYDVIVVGAGAAGLMAAGTAAKNGSRVLLLEKMEKPARKIRITGKGRCNVTNARPPEDFASQVRVSADFFTTAAFPSFDNLATMRFFERMGVTLVTERGDRVFPESGKAADIANSLEFFCRDNGVTIQCDTRVKEIMTLGDKVFGVKYFNKRGFERKEECANVIVTTGGISYPATGSSGDGYGWAADLGHTIEPLRPSLTALRTSHPQARYLEGIVLRNVNVSLFADNVLLREEFGEMSFSERGLEGAVILRISRDAVDALIDKKSVKVSIDLKPALSEEVLVERIHREIESMQPEDYVSELLRRLVPKPLVVPIAKELDVHSQTYVSKISEVEITRLIKILKGFVFPVSGYAPFEYAVTTAGGVHCDEVNPETMESKKVRGLYFAGEVLDIDANTGGYNLQIAFSTGHLAGMLKHT